MSEATSLNPFTGSLMTELNASVHRLYYDIVLATRITMMKIDYSLENSFYVTYFPHNGTLADYDQELNVISSPCGIPDFKFCSTNCFVPELSVF